MFKNLGILNKNSKAEELYNWSFKTAGIIIAKMDDYQKADVAAEIDTICLHLNTQMCLIDEYTMEDGYPRPMCSMADYMFMQSMTKRYGILLNYLFQINDMIQEKELQQLLKEFSEADTLSADTMKRIPSYEADLASIAGAQQRTEDIMSLACSLTLKYNK